MSGILTKVRSLPTQYPLIRGMISYAIIWPTCSMVQEYIENGTPIDNADYARAARFGIFGTFFMAPVFYGWMKYTNRFFKSTSLKTAVLRAAIEQISYSPLAMAYFFFGMSLLEMKPVKDCVNEVREKFWPTYRIGAIFWPTAQSLNFYFISEQNRILFVSAASFVWTVYLAHMKAKQPEKSLQKDKSRHGLDSSLGLAPGVVNTFGENVIKSGDVMNTSGDMNAPGDVMNKTSDVLNMSVEAKTSDEIPNKPEEIFNTPDEIVKEPREYVNTLNEIVKDSGEFVNTPLGMDMLTEAVDKSLLEIASSAEKPCELES